MADSGNVFGTGAEFHGHHSLRNELAGHRAHNVYAQDFVGLGIGQELHHARGVTQGACTAVCQEWERTRFIGHAIGLELLLSAATHAISGLV